MTTHRPLAAALWMSGAIFSFTAMAIAGRAVADAHDTFEIMMWRSVVGFALVLAVAGSLGRLREVRRDRMAQHLVRNLFHFSGQNLWFWSLTMIPLAQVFALEFTSPIWVILLSPLVLGERLTRPRLIAAGLGFVGILIVARPDFAALDAGVLAAAGSAVCFAATTLMTKRLTRGESIVSILFWLTLMQGCFGAVMAGHDGVVTLPTAATLPWLALIGFCGLLAHTCLTTALSLAPASYVVPVDFIRLPVIAVVGVMLYSEPLDPLVLLGALVIFAGNWINIRAETRKSATVANSQIRDAAS
ncbi:DMT family transporter [Rhodobacteraceae bacterium HSP-20]|uniref:DMT family transporter n=1 Tax=Paragemmobacter amnigenus TaxID=2852097 RepID=A0ABS6IXQ3_9RHOB|nr:DMT family transporter [Rhodobacter amnigenus]MBU9696283.1 DMT family transporter [Rhodobacter amnigenus]MBV4387510.1 DMT family transporter [Rhodobacter amnigenus]